MTKFIRKLGSLKFTLAVLFLLAAVSGLGTLIAQNQPASFYSEHYGKSGARLILFLNADNFYQSFIFGAVLFLLGLNLLICVINSFKKNIFKHGKTFALFLIHLSILLIFAAALISRFTRYTEHVKLSPGEKIILPGSETVVGFEKFEIDYYPESDDVRAYRSDFYAVEPGTEKKDFVLRVNHPRAIGKHVFYQSGFEPRAKLKLRLGHAGRLIWEGALIQGQQVRIMEDKNLILEIGDFIPDARIENNKILLRSYRIKEAAILINVYKDDALIEQSWVSNSARLNAEFSRQAALFDLEVEDLELDFFTIVQIVRDAGIPWVWSGFAALLGGIVLFLFNKKF